MKVSLLWLREYVSWTGDARALGDLLTMAGVELEGIEQRGVAIPNVVVAQILASEQHPNADRLSVCRVDDGSGTERQIVCGAKNYRVGDRVPLAQPGAVLPGDFKIKVGKLRGVESQGMLCSATELGLPAGEDGLLILPSTARVGASLEELYPADTVLDLEITPNRPDLLSHIGVAREVAALTGAALKPPRGLVAETDFVQGVAIHTRECPFYSARRIAGVVVGPSPAWLRQRLEAIGVRSINNVVDITNYVMFELGQPLHAFDAAKLSGDLQVRCGEGEGEPFLALDGRTYQVTCDHMVIADGERAVAIAGVMGGEGAGVTAATTDIWLESAFFQAGTVRQAARELGIFSDSSYRFEREVDPAGVLVASQHAAEMIRDLCGGTIGELRLGFAANAQFGWDPQASRDGHAYGGVVPLRPDRVCDLIGVFVDPERQARILTAFGLLQAEGGWRIPTFRPDLTREVDLIEEIARVIGLHEVPGALRATIANSTPADAFYDRTMAVRRALAAAGVHEARSLTLVGEEAAALPLTQAGHSPLRIRNPMNADQVVLRPGLLPGLLKAVRHNANAGASAIRLFEVGRVFSAATVEETMHLGIVLTGTETGRTWRGGPERLADLWDLKGLLTTVLGVAITFEREENPALALTLAISLGGQRIGFAGQLWPAEARACDVETPLVFAEIGLTAWAVASTDDTAHYREISRFPAITRDVALIAPANLSHARIAETLAGAGETLLERAELFDVFTDPSGEKVPADKKSVAYSLTYRSPARTLLADEVNAAHGRLKERLRGLGATLRE